MALFLCVLYANRLAFQCRSPIAAQILSPDGETTILPGTDILLQGYACDLEDGVLEESALQWSSGRDGPLGGGSQVLVTLSARQHVVTLAAEESGNRWPRQPCPKIGLDDSSQVSSEAQGQN